MLLLLKAVLTPLVVVFATLLGRRFGPSVAGWLVGFPFTSAPVSVFLTIEQGRSFAATASHGTIFSALADVGFVLVYARLARAGILAALAGASAVFALAGYALVATSPDPVVATVVLLLALLVAPRLVKVPAFSRSAAPVPPWDLPVRAAVATALVLGITTLAPLLGPVPSGIIAGFPVYASVLAVFADRVDGPDAGTSVMRGLLAGLFGYASFFVVIAVAIERVLPAIAFAMALVTVLAVQGLSLAVLRRGLRPIEP